MDPINNRTNDIGLESYSRESPSDSSVRPEFSSFNREFRSQSSWSNRRIDWIEVETDFQENLENCIVQNEKAEKSAQKKATLMKVLFISLLIIGIIGAASFFLLPALETIAVGLSLSLLNVTIAWQAIFLGGGLLALFSFIPRRFVKQFNKDKNHYHEKVEALKFFYQQGNFRTFLEAELNGRYQHPEVIAKSADFVNLYYQLQNLNEKRQDIARFEREVQSLRQLIRPNEVLSNEGENSQGELNRNLNDVTNKIREMNREVRELENEINDLRDNLVHLDREFVN